MPRCCSDCNKWFKDCEPQYFHGEWSVCCKDCNNYQRCEKVKQEREANIEAIANNLYLKLRGDPPINIIFFLGAGASANSGVLTSEKIKKKIVDQVAQLRADSLLSEIISEIKKRLKHVDKFSRINTIFDEEVSLQIVASAIAQDQGEGSVRVQFKKYFPDRNTRKMPSITYEIISHLVNHSLLTEIISVNYDELLGKSLDDEIGYENYFQAVSSVDFELIERGSINKPRILKPHGTISAPSSMKFTFEHVESLDPPIKSCLRNILLGSPRPIIVFVGYRCNDLDIKSLLREVSEAGPVDANMVYWVIRWTTDIYRSGIYETLSKFGLNRTKNIVPCASSDEFFQEIITALNRRIYERDGLRGLVNVTRHKIREFFFESKIPDNIENKFLLEVIIYALKAKGAFYLRNLTNCRRIANYTAELRRQG